MVIREEGEEALGIRLILHLSSYAAAAEFEGWAVQEGWPEVVLPSSGEAAQYFGGSLAPPDNQVRKCPISLADPYMYRVLLLPAIGLHIQTRLAK